MSESGTSLPMVDIYTDGACSGNPGPGGWAALLQFKGQSKEISGADADTTNNRMEMMAVIRALSELKRPCHVRLHSDSALIINTMTKGWIENWQRTGWRKADKKPVENKDLWEAMLDAMKNHRVEWIKVKGHADDERNNRVDALAVAAIKTLVPTS
jgi:ribonuclease HI